ncbi:MAG TPA: energy transducer TonB [Saprospiraceae bacterium]|nr:energy transducer TonB [Saprospiraceae bacterium]
MSLVKHTCYFILLIPGLVNAQAVDKLISGALKGAYIIQKLNPHMYEMTDEYFTQSMKTSGVGPIIRTYGTFDNDKRTGVWITYDSHEALRQIYDYSKKELIFNSFDEDEKEKTYKVIIGKKTSLKKLDRPPVYIGKEIIQHVRFRDYFPGIPDNRISRSVIIGFIIDKRGIASDYKVIKGLGEDLDKEAIEKVERIPQNWIPGLLKGKPVEVEYTLPVKYYFDQQMHKIY